MNNRDLKLYSYLKSKGGGPTPPSPSVKWPRLIDYEWYYGGRWITSYTMTQTFNLKKDDIVLAFSVTARSVTFPTGFETISSITDSITLTTAKYVCLADESVKFKITQSGEDKLGVVFIQLRDCELYETTDFNSTGIARGYTLPNALPCIMAVGCSTSNGTGVGLEKRSSNAMYTITNGGSASYCYVRAYFNFGTFANLENKDVFNLTGDGTILTTGVYLVDPTQE